LARRRGLSLVELIVSLFLFGLLSSCIAVLIRTGLEYLRQAEARAELQRSSLFVLSEMTREIAESSRDAIRLADPGEPPGLVYASPRGTNGVSYINNRLAWKQLACIYLDDSNHLLMKAREDLASASTFVPDLSPLGLNRSVSHFVALNPGSKNVLARNVSAFEVSGTGHLTLRLEVSLEEGSFTSRLSSQTGVSPGH
jgi:prepilin-type N-terminal cleavage/methylation domain-containing protein